MDIQKLVEDYAVWPMIKIVRKKRFAVMNFSVLNTNGESLAMYRCKVQNVSAPIRTYKYMMAVLVLELLVVIVDPIWNVRRMLIARTTSVIVWKVLLKMTATNVMLRMAPYVIQYMVGHCLYNFLNKKLMYVQ